MQSGHGLAPFCQPGSSSWRLLRSTLQFRSELNQVGSHVNIIERVSEASRELKRLGTREQSIESAPCSHPIVLEECRIDGVCSHQVIASVMCGSDNYVACRQCLKSAFRNRRWQVWAI